jgi:hypothetical protein
MHFVSQRDAYVQGEPARVEAAEQVAIAKKAARARKIKTKEAAATTQAACQQSAPTSAQAAAPPGAAATAATHSIARCSAGGSRDASDPQSRWQWQGGATAHHDVGGALPWGGAVPAEPWLDDDVIAYTTDADFQNALIRRQLRS